MLGWSMDRIGHLFVYYEHSPSLYDRSYLNNLLPRRQEATPARDDHPSILHLTDAANNGRAKLIIMTVTTIISDSHVYATYH